MWEKAAEVSSTKASGLPAQSPTGSTYLVWSDSKWPGHAARPSSAQWTSPALQEVNVLSCSLQFPVYSGRSMCSLCTRVHFFRLTLSTEVSNIFLKARRFLSILTYFPSLPRQAAVLTVHPSASDVSILELDDRLRRTLANVTPSEVKSKAIPITGRGGL
jgi:hypothetical protein